MKGQSLTTKKKTAVKLAVSAGLSIASCALSAYAAVPGDYTGDGKADLVVASVDRSRRKTTFSIKQVTGESSSVVVNGTGDALVPGDFDGNGTMDPAVVFVQSNAKLKWYITTPSGLFTEEFGINGDQPLAGDIDCDGKADRVLVRKSGDKMYWYAMTSLGDHVLRYPFGAKNDTPYLADVNGDGCDELVVSRTKGSEINWWYTKLNEGVEHFASWGVKGDTPQTPFDVNGDGVADWIVIRVINKTSLKAFVLNSDQTASEVDFGAKTNLPLFGRYSGAAVPEHGVYQSGTNNASSKFLIDLPAGTTTVNHGKNSSILIRPDNSVIQPGSGFGECENVISISKLSRVLYKPINVHGGRGPTLIISNGGEKTGLKKLEVRDVNCKVIGALGLFADGPPYGARYYSKTSPGTGKTGSQLLDLAKKAGSNAVLIKGKNKWIKIDNPTERQGSL